jgi:hypothetical protein
MWIGRGNRSTRRKPAPGPLCPPQIPHHLTRARTRAAAVGSRRLTAWAMARPRPHHFWDSASYILGTGNTFAEGKAAEARSRSLNSIHSRS